MSQGAKRRVRDDGEQNGEREHEEREPVRGGGAVVSPEEREAHQRDEPARGNRRASRGAPRLLTAEQPPDECGRRRRERDVERDETPERARLAEPDEEALVAPDVEREAKRRQRDDRGRHERRVADEDGGERPDHGEAHHDGPEPARRRQGRAEPVGREIPAEQHLGGRDGDEAADQDDARAADEHAQGAERPEHCRCVRHRLVESVPPAQGLGPESPRAACGTEA